jgi:hypothetical protein
MLVWAKKVPEDGERGKTEYQHAVHGINHDGRIAKSDEAEPERMLVSGDEIDVYFALRDAIHLVEAKSVHSSEI